MEIRASRPADRAVLVAFMAALQEAERQLVDNRAPGGEMADAHLAYLEAQAADGGAVLLASIGGEPVGFVVVLVEQGDEGEVHLVAAERRHGVVTDLYVVPRCRRAGVANRLLEAAAAHCRGVGLKSLLITSLAGNLPALRAYRGAGFEPYEFTFRQRL